MVGVYKGAIWFSVPSVTGVQDVPIVGGHGYLVFVHCL